MLPALRQLPTYSLAQRRPQRGQRVMLTVQDALPYGPYPLPFACLFDGSGFSNAITGTPITLSVVAWRPVHILDQHQRRNPGRLTARALRS